MEKYYNKYVCFVAGTRVLTPNGYRPIELIEEGDSVMSHSMIERKVLTKFESETTELIHVETEWSDVYCTPNHKFLTVSNDYQTFKQDGEIIIVPTFVKWKEAQHLGTGDLIVSPIISSKIKGYYLGWKSDNLYKVRLQKVESTESFKTNEKVYNLEVQYDNTYVVESLICKNCKHIFAVCKVLPFISRTIASKMKNSTNRLTIRK